MQIPRFKRWRLWTPADLSPLAWFDAKDGTYITQAGGLVSQWDDRSGNARHISQASGPNQPAYASDTVTFDGATSYLFNTSPFMYANGNLSVSYVGAVNNAIGTDRRLLSEASTTNNTPMYDPAENHNTDASQMCVFIRNDANSALINHVALSASGAFNNTQRLYIWGDTGSRIMGNFNGGVLTQSSYTRSGTITTDRFTMGCVLRATTAAFWPGTVNEIIITSFMETQARLCMEGWLAWKWGLQASLPTGHRFKGEPPRVPLG